MRIISLLVLITISIFAQDDSIIKLFPGKWNMNSEKTEYYEKWDILNETELVGVGFSIEEGDTVKSEQLCLKKFSDHWAYIAIPENQTITLFALTEFSNNKFIFENEEHDYPQKVIYEFTTDGNLNAAVEGMINGELIRRDFMFIRDDK